jgi:hypothetical protein
VLIQRSKIRGIDESKVRQGRLRAGTGKVKVQHGGPVRSARRRAKDLGNGSQLEKKASDRSRADNECGMRSDSYRGAPTAACQLRLAVVGDLPSACRRKERGPSWRSNPPQPAFSLGSN